VGWDPEAFRCELTDRVGGSRFAMRDQDVSGWRSAIDEDTRGFGFEQILRSGDRSGRPEKRDLHADFQIQSAVDSEYDNPKERKLVSGLCAP
jgi:hypothetical protein